MKNRLLKTTVAIAALAVAGLPSVASAAKVQILASSEQGAGNLADDFAPDFAAILQSDAFWVAPGALEVTPPPASEGGIYKSPFANTPLGDSTDTDAGDPPDDNTYWSVGPGSADSPQTMNFLSSQSGFEMLWGSIDSYNRIEFFAGADATGGSLASWTGTELVENSNSDVVGSVTGCGTAANFECVS